MRCLYYSSFVLQGLPSLRSLDGQPAIAVGDPRFRSGQLWTRSKGHGIELAEATINTGKNPVFEDNTSWANYSEGSGAGTRTYGYVTHDLMAKITTAFRLIKTDGGADRWGLTQTNAAWNGVQHTYTVYFKVISYSSGANFILHHTDANRTTINLNSGHIGKWTRAVLTGSAAGSGVYIWIDTANADILVTGLQVEAKAYATPFHTLDSYNKSGDQDARSAQYLKIPMAGNFSGMDGGSILISLRPDFSYDIPAERAFWAMHETDTTKRWHISYRHSVDKWRFEMYKEGVADTIIDSAAQSFSLGTKHLIIVTWDGTNGELYINGVAAPTQTKTQVDIPLPDHMALGAFSWATTNIFNGVIDEFAIFDVPFTQRMVDHVYDNLFSKGKTLLGAGFYD